MESNNARLPAYALITPVRCASSVGWWRPCADVTPSHTHTSTLALSNNAVLQQIASSVPWLFSGQSWRLASWPKLTQGSLPTQLARSINSFLWCSFSSACIMLTIIECIYKKQSLSLNFVFQGVSISGTLSKLDRGLRWRTRATRPPRTHLRCRQRPLYYWDWRSVWRYWQVLNWSSSHWSTPDCSE